MFPACISSGSDWPPSSSDCSSPFASSLGAADAFPLGVQLVVFALLSVATVFGVKRVTGASPSDHHPDINTPGSQFIGRMVVVEEAITRGRARSAPATPFGWLKAKTRQRVHASPSLASTAPLSSLPLKQKIDEQRAPLSHTRTQQIVHVHDSDGLTLVDDEQRRDPRRALIISSAAEAKVVGATVFGLLVMISPAVARSSFSPM